LRQDLFEQEIALAGGDQQSGGIDRQDAPGRLAAGRERAQFTGQDLDHLPLPKGVGGRPRQKAADQVLDLGRGFCTLQATKEKLSTACLNYGISNEAAHRAVTDARATALLLGKIFREDGALVPVQIEGSSARRSARIFARPASQKEQAPDQMTLMDSKINSLFASS
jgi:hypothetical protein